MANSITLSKDYQEMLDEVYASAALTGDLTAAAGKVRPGSKAGTFEIQKVTVPGLGTYSRATGHPAGNAGLTWEEKTYTCDRGRTFPLDAMDADEALISVSTLGGEFVRTKVVPEIDAYRFATLATQAGIDATGSLSVPATALAAWDAALLHLGDKHVPRANLRAYMSFTLYGALKNSTAVTRFAAPSDTEISRDFGRFDGIPITTNPLSLYVSFSLTRAGS